MYDIEQVEETLVRELREVADGVEVPALPPLPEDRPSAFTRTTLLVAAAVVLVVLGAVATVAMLGDDERLQPAPAPSPSPSRATEKATDTATDGAAETLSDAPTGVPHLLGDRLFVGGQQVPGQWAYVRGTETGWIGGRYDGSWWLGHETQSQRIEGTMPQGPAISPSGEYEAEILVDGGTATLTGAETQPGGEGLGGVEVKAVSRGIATRVVAVTDDGLVVVRGGDFSLLWRPLVDGGTVDLGTTAPGQMVVGNTGAGLVVVPGDDTTTEAYDGEPYLADIDEGGTITPRQQVPPSAQPIATDEWLAWASPDTVGGEAAIVPELQVQRLDGSDAGVIAPPKGWDFRMAGWRFENVDHVVATVNNGTRERMVRCAPATQECVLLENP